jgi:hypothetical protein
MSMNEFADPVRHVRRRFAVVESVAIETLIRLLGHLWTLPNTLLALTFGIGGRYRLDRQNRVFVIIGGWVPRIFRRLCFAGMCIGDVVLCAYNLPRDSPDIYRHELVHATQSRLLGPLYLPITLLLYTYGYFRFPRNGHDASPLEIWADVASGNEFRNEYLRYRNRPR